MVRRGKLKPSQETFTGWAWVGDDDFWNKDILEDTQGLDILGVRALDEGIESNLVNGVTTVSTRGRHFSILPWAIG